MLIDKIQMNQNTNGIDITQVSDHLKEWYSYMPNDITLEDIVDFDRAHKAAIKEYPSFITQFMTKDVTFPGCYLASRLREKGISQQELDQLNFNLGRLAMMDAQGQWKRVMKIYKEYNK